MSAPSPCAPYLRDAHYRYLIGAPADALQERLAGLGATSIIHHINGDLAGVYVDNETGSAPLGSAAQLAQRDAIAVKLHAEIPHKLVVVGLYPSEPGHKISGCVCALEWYPYHSYEVSPPRGQAGYILQWNYAAPGDRPPTPVEAARLLSIVEAYKPEILLVY